MTIASLFLALIVTTAADAPSGDPVLLDFHAPWCGPCQTMRPAVAGLVKNKYPVKSIDIDRSPKLAERYGVTAVPTFIVVDAEGKVLARTSGAMPAARLAAFYNGVKANLDPPEKVEGRDAPAAVLETAPDREPESESAPAVANPRPWETVVRIKMHLSDREWGYGSGTIISSTPEESIILTCAHIFRLKGQKQPQPKDFRTPITVDLFDGTFTSRHPAMIRCSEKDVVGQAIDYDFTNDVGLIRIKPGRRLASSRVVPAHWKPERGMRMFAVGCSHGDDATAWDTKILDPKVTMTNTETRQSFSEIKCLNQPKEGRSGGGLYTEDGFVAGVCDFADPNEHVGLYAVPDAIHRMLDRNRLTALYKPTTDRPGTMLAGTGANPRPTPSPATRYRGQSPSEGESGALRVAANPEDITIPPPDMLGIRTPRSTAAADPGPKTWQPNQVRTAKSDRLTRGLDADQPAVDPGAPQPAGLGMTPSSESQAFDNLEARSPRRTEPDAPAVRPTTPGKWRPVRSRPVDETPATR